VRLVRAAQTQQAPFVRLPDRYAAVVLPLTLVVAGAAWAASGDVLRALAVLVAATPCPLILAAPIALISGISRAARIGVIVPGGGTGCGRRRGIAAAAAADEVGSGRARIMVGLDGKLAGYIVMGDRLRSDAAELVRALRRSGIRHVALATGDRREVAEEIGRA